MHKARRAAIRCDRASCSSRASLIYSVRRSGSGGPQSLAVVRDDRSQGGTGGERPTSC